MKDANKGCAKHWKYLFLSVAIAVLITEVLLGGVHSSMAAVRPPIAVTIATTDKIVVGQQMTVQVVLQAGDLQDVSFKLIIPEGWLFVGGHASWSGSLQAGQPVKFEAIVIPSMQDPEDIRGTLKVPGWNQTEWRMQMEGGAE
ncbi:MAG: hypothetical protein A2075_21295 [Geobacteraceae bacterium GWC2_58_44]|nr:MAG: hypothetical protein A2075_21295 [Geobacteraceae bacterium GWC2_58_44]HBG04588.1 hypothetical protein [Geobacter sp.]